MTDTKEKLKTHFALTHLGWALFGLTTATIILHLAWNMAMPVLFGAEAMSFNNAFGLLLLTTITSFAINGKTNHNRLTL